MTSRGEGGLSAKIPRKAYLIARYVYVISSSFMICLSYRLKFHDMFILSYDMFILSAQISRYVYFIGSNAKSFCDKERM